MYWLSLLISLIFGFCAGSFINAVIYRLKNNLPIFIARSICVKCKRILEPRDLVPILSYIFLKGRCRYCDKKISAQYPIVEFITGLLFVLIFLHFENLSEIALYIYWYFAVILVIIFIYDLKYYLILDHITLPAIIISLILNIFLLNKGDSISNLFISYWVAMLFGGLFFYLQFVLTAGKGIGGGDVRLGILMGAIVGWPNIVTAIILGYIFGFFFGLGYIIFYKGRLDSKVPLGTFLTTSAFITLLYSNVLAEYAAAVFSPFYTFLKLIVE